MSFIGKRLLTFCQKSFSIIFKNLFAFYITLLKNFKQRAFLKDFLKTLGGWGLKDKLRLKKYEFY